MKKISKFLIVFLLCTNIYAVNNSLITAEAFPDKLSDFSFFKDSSAQIPHDDVVPYELISTLFSDYSYKQRWVYVPKDTKAKYEENWVFDFPEGSAFEGGLGLSIFGSTVLVKASTPLRISFAASMSLAFNSCTAN